MSNSRTKNVSLNMIISLICQIINLAINFVSRTIFIATLGAEYLGINGLFTNVLTVLSFAELGIGNAMVFSMYRPLTENDTDKLASLMALYKKVYDVIALVVLISGLCVIPFLDILINEQPNIYENLLILYLLFLLNTVLSYCFVYKKSIIIADQKNYVVLSITEIAHILQILAQIVFLYITHNFVIFLILQAVGTFSTNIISAIVANKMYPFLKRNALPLKKEESKNIFKNVKAMAAYKFGSVILNGTSNILVSAWVGVREVGLVSNYTLLTSACNAILSNVTDAFTASVGNLNTVANKEKQYEVFKKILLITMWIYGFAAVGLILILDPFITAWLGKDYLLGGSTSAAIVLGFFIQGVHTLACTYRITLGLFVKGRFAPIFSSILNIILAFILFKYLGITGIFLATPIARAIVIGVVDIVLIYREVFKRNPISYYLTCLCYVTIFIVILSICQVLFGLVNYKGWFEVILKILIVTVIYNIAMLLIFYKTKMFKEIFKAFFKMLREKKVD